MSDDIVARLRKIREMIGAMCADGRPPRMSIPARPDEDEDIVISDAADDAADLIDQQAARIKELERDAAFRLEASSRETEEARFYRYLRDEAGQLPGDHDGPMICSGLGDNFDYLRGEECDKEIRAAIERKARAALGE